MQGNQFAKEALDNFNSFAPTSIPHTINFYRQQELPFGIFSNFFPAKIVINEIVYLTSEHYFQAFKFQPTCQQSFNDVVNCATPGDAAAVGRDRSRPLRPDWEKVKDDIMYDALTAKFLQHESLLTILMKTDGCKLVEHTARDSYWGDGGDGSGKHMLGILLMKLRDDLKKIPDLAKQRVVFNQMMRETGVNPLKHQIPSSSPAATGTTTNDNDNDDQEEGQTSSSSSEKKKKNRLQ
jgi:ribA/ribD-fused uncharacterized protein